MSIRNRTAAQSLQVALNRIKALEEIVKAVAHIGVDFGHGEYVLEVTHIKHARELLEAP